MLIHIKMKIDQSFHEAGVEIDAEATEQDKHEAATLLLFEATKIIYTELGLIQDKSFEEIVLQK